MKAATVLFVCATGAVASTASAQTIDAAARLKQPPPVFELTPEAYIQLDWRGYPESPVAPGSGRLEFNTFEIRRLRAGVNGRWRGVRFEMTLDPRDADGSLVKDAYAEIRPGKFEIRFGQFKLPGSRDYSVAARSTDLMERSALGDSLAAHRDLGASLHGDLGKTFDYEVGLFAGDNNGTRRRSGVTAAGRLEWEPNRKLVAALYASDGKLTAVDSEPENGLEGRLSSGYRFYENVYVQGRRTRWGGDVEWSPGKWQLTAEALRERDERKEQGVDLDDLPSAVGIGANVTARWRFADRRELTARYEYLGFDDVGPATAMASVRPRAGDIRARSAQAITVGGSWRLQRWLRVMSEAGVEWYSDPRTAPEAGRDTGYWTLGLRLQVELPGNIRWRVQ
jgi:hypothetical protein